MNALPGITITPLADGGTIVHLAAARNLSNAITLTVGSVMFTTFAMLELFHFFNFVLIFAITFLALTLVVISLTIHSWFSSATITARPQALLINSRLLFFRRVRELQASDITDIIPRNTSRTWSTLYFTLVAQLGTKKINIVGGVRGKEAADYLAAELKRAIKTSP